MKTKALIAQAAAAGMLLVALLGAQTPTEKLRITAFAVNMSNIGQGGNAVVEIRIDSWSTPQERATIINALIEKGEDGLMRALQKGRTVGRWNIPGYIGPDIHQLRLGHDLHYAWQTPLPDGGKRIVLATDRYIGFVEARDSPRTIDYPFTLMELRVNKAGEGEGKMAVATKITFNKKTQTLELENYSSEPVRLQNLKVNPK